MRLVLILFASSLYGRSSLQFLDIGSGSACCVTSDDSGNSYAVATQNFKETSPNISSPGTIVVTKMDANNNVVYHFAFPSPGGEPTGIAVDAQQNVVVVGSANPEDLASFP